MSLALVWKDLSLEEIESVSSLLNDKPKAEEFPSIHSYSFDFRYSVYNRYLTTNTDG